ncbi:MULTISPECIES: (d)CMP kinase [unclassified Candidatus Frackibacter]|uniref:(d)CMP kinase n=1 Tax=unclassified Candidatus Frackibacter TaxID=2648818 RepID=UPI00087E83C7|nr:MULTISPECIES: (d)CMP kinase [unclassified Candidatus Frackibacter]SDC52129.1 cytidylate kinase [Candidatus Frackibacter sp. WG11]SEM41373.1 cytidylate kinase [Candidatus Frackibacter sp. WG12]SFL76043.1 cytidylate kinase [Candidatus Frackibacter sp. WG13]
MKSDLVIAIDGPAGAGKSTIAKQVAEELGSIYIDTGAMYRALTLKALRLEIDIGSEQELANLAKNTEIRFRKVDNQDRILLDNEDVSEEIRSQAVSNHVSLVAKVPAVRKELVNLQRKMAKDTSVVMDGRDIGTVVLPNADVKIFLTASVEERTKRRYEELKLKGEEIDFFQLKSEIIRRDKLDRERVVAPLKKADDAIELDSTKLTIREVVEEVLRLC